MKVIPFHQMAAVSYRKGISYIRTDIVKAINYVERASLLNPYNSEYIFKLGILYSDINELERSDMCFKKAMLWNPGMTESLYYMGKNRLKVNDDSGAFAYFYRYLFTDKQGYYKKEVNNYIRGLKSDMTTGKMIMEGNEEKESISMKCALDDYIHNKQYGKAAVYLEEMLYENPMCIMARNALSLVYFYEGRIDDAIYMTYSVLRINRLDIHASINLDIYTSYASKPNDV